jgi:hypothetical protein
MPKIKQLWIKYRWIGLGALVMSSSLIGLGYVLDPKNMGYVNWLGIIGFSVGLLGLFVSLNDIQKKVEEVLNRYFMLDGAKESDTIRRRVRFAMNALTSDDWIRCANELLEVRDLMIELRHVYARIGTEKETLQRFNSHLDALASIRSSIDDVRTIGQSDNLWSDLDKVSIRTKLDGLDVFLTEQLTKLRYASR